MNRNKYRARRHFASFDWKRRNIVYLLGVYCVEDNCLASRNPIYFETLLLLDSRFSGICRYLKMEKFNWRTRKWSHGVNISNLFFRGSKGSILGEILDKIRLFVKGSKHNKHIKNDWKPPSWRCPIYFVIRAKKILSGALNTTFCS